MNRIPAVTVVWKYELVACFTCLWQNDTQLVWNVSIVIVLKNRQETLSTRALDMIVEADHILKINEGSIFESFVPH